MDSFSDKRESLPPPPALSHHHHHHQCLEVSPHCPQHGGYVSHHNHHHNHLALSPNCPLHRHLLPHCEIHTTPNFPFPPNPNFNIVNSEAHTNSKPEPLMIQETSEEVELEDGEDEIIFVLTDEWKEFFAKSEAKRRLAKMQARKKGKT